MEASDHGSSKAVGELCKRYSGPQETRQSSGVAIMWFRNDLRVLDNEALFRAWKFSEVVLPVFCLDPRLFGTTHYFGFPKTGELRAQFILESISDLRSRLQQRGSDLVVRYGMPEQILPSIVEGVCASTVYAHKETCSEELLVEKNVKQALKKLTFLKTDLKNALLPAQGSVNARLELIWGSTLYHLKDIHFSPAKLPDVYTQFRKAVESTCKIRSCFKLPLSLAPLPKDMIDKIGGIGKIPNLSELGLTVREQSASGVMRFTGGETEGLARLEDYFWAKDYLRSYKETRNGMLGSNYSTKFSPWLASGCLSPRLIFEEVKRYERERIANESTYWILFELLWRDYFRFLSIKYGNNIFHLGGPRKVVQKSWSQSKDLFEAWRNGCTGYPLIDANMKELSATGFMSNRGRQIVCSFMVRDLGLDWRMGAEWFETCLLDYDPCSNYGNWTYGAGVGNDPREDRYFSIPKQAQSYDPNGDYVAHWLPELSKLPKAARHFPGKDYIKPIVPLKFGMGGQIHRDSRVFLGGYQKDSRKSFQNSRASERRT
ncbi:hypothetical protein O6H91_03G040700 [Diphasiastrum complanatum]|uniref:Uncharacterized protein n=1 Tax=Diphasiastrum complanatum TaxID=34168 RepID=A0ACC2E5P7_DIPCM|nr:hypothetical protein O6H91_03G040700 [Diphasiastrum complanatum]